MENEKVCSNPERNRFKYLAKIRKQNMGNHVSLKLGR